MTPDEHARIAALLAELEVNPPPGAHERLIVALLRRIDARAEATDEKLSAHIAEEADLATLWRDAKGAARVLAWLVSLLAVLGGAFAALREHISIGIK